MCIAIVKTKNGKLTEEQLRNCFKNNKDGAGIAYTKDGKLYVFKGMFKVEDFLNVYNHCLEEADGTMLIHCRISTSGNIDKDNCHPFVVHDNCVMIHNGVLDIDVPKGSKKNDTRIFIDKYLKPLHRNFMFDKSIMNLVEGLIGDTNKFCFLNSNGKAVILNESEGEWVDGTWFSNESYKERKIKITKYNSLGFPEEDVYELSNADKLELEHLILRLNNEQLIKLGQYPVYDSYELELRRVEGRLAYDEAYLYDYDEYLGELYDEMYTEAVEQTLRDVEKMSDDDVLEDYEAYVYKKFNTVSGISDDEEEEFITTYDGYFIDVVAALNELGYYDEEDVVIKMNDNDTIDAPYIDGTNDYVDVDYSTDDTYAEV